MMKAVVLVLSLSVLPLVSVACPLGPKEDHLTISRIMRNFGKGFDKAETVARKASDPWDAANDNDFKAGIEGLNMAISCAAAVLANPTGELLPSKLMLMTDEAQKKELTDAYIYFMEDFKEGLTEYRDLLTQNLAKKPEERDFAAIIHMNEQMNKRINKAHKSL
ncbi:MAG: hypothetical protein J7501_04150 [Bdellovibrio sp.]|nr:hypothetical protein [Bdellovibrio sp.]